MQMVGEGSIFERGAHVPVIHMDFCKPPATAVVSELKAKVGGPRRNESILMRQGCVQNCVKPQFRWPKMKR